MEARVVIGAGILAEVVRHAKASLPDESCGFLVGRSEAVERLEPAPNALGSPTAFKVEPQFLFDFFRRLRLSGENLKAIYHSHPTGSAYPSVRDIAQASDPSVAHVIVSLAGSEPEVRAYRIVGGEVFEIELHAIV